MRQKCPKFCEGTCPVTNVPSPYPVHDKNVPSVLAKNVPSVHAKKNVPPSPLSSLSKCGDIRLFMRSSPASQKQCGLSTLSSPQYSEAEGGLLEDQNGTLNKVGKN